MSGIGCASEPRCGAAVSRVRCGIRVSGFQGGDVGDGTELSSGSLRALARFHATMIAPRGEAAERLVPYPVFLRRGDGRSEVDSLIAELAGVPGGAGLHKYLYAAEADQTVVMVTSRDVPLARVLRERAEWLEPMEGN